MNRLEEELQAANQQLMAIEEELRQQLLNIENKQEALDSAHQQLIAIVDFLPDPTFVIDKGGRVKMWNRAMEEMTGVSKEEILDRTGYEHTIPFYGEKQPMLADLVLMPADERKLLYPELKEENEVLMIEKHIDKSGKQLFLSAKASPLYNQHGQLEGAIESLRDISEQKKAEIRLKRSEARYRNILESIEDGYFEVDYAGNFTCFNTALQKMLAYSRPEMQGMNYKLIMDKENAVKVFKTFNQVYNTGKSIKEFGWYLSKKDGSRIYVESTIIPIMKFNEVVGFRGLIRDITERKNIEEQLKHMSLHDGLTGSYNRFYFEEEMRRMEDNRHNPVGIIIFDVDGLKLVNDTLGHDKGDQLLITTAEIIRHSFRKSDVVARVGGDEFGVLLSKTPLNMVEQYLQRVNRSVEEYNKQHPELPLSLSSGYSLRNDTETTMKDTFKEADNRMYRHKLHSRKSTRSVLVSTLMKALEARDFITEGHGDRLQELVEKMAIALNLSGETVKDLRLLAQFHDIGKVGVPDSILFKNGPLTPQEYIEMQRHSEIGHRIALVAPDLVIIADWILKHHEWWNGQGYPFGLKGEEIPLECRILSISDAFDAMTNDRPYRKALSFETAINEIRRFAGIQFDPLLVEHFIELITPEAY